MKEILDWLGSNWEQLAFTLGWLVAYAIIDRISTPRIEEGAEESGLQDSAARNAVRLARAIIGVFGLLILLVIWGVDLQSVVFFVTTTITLLGVAMFATWSILSNVTAYFILIMHGSLQRGSFVRVLDSDNYVEGYIAEITLFNTKLVTKEREEIIYPNNLFIGRPAVVNPREHWGSLGKIKLPRDSHDGPPEASRQSEAPS